MGITNAMTTPTSMGNHGGTVMSRSPYAHPGSAEICILHGTWSTVALGTYELAFLIKKKGKRLLGCVFSGGASDKVREWVVKEMRVPAHHVRPLRGEFEDKVKQF